MTVICPHNADVIATAWPVGANFKPHLLEITQASSISVIITVQLSTRYVSIRFSSLLPWQLCRYVIPIAIDDDDEGFLASFVSNTLVTQYTQELTSPS